MIKVSGAEERACTLDDLYGADEAFLASTTREVEPVAAIDDRVFDGPEPVSDRTRAAALERIRAQLGSVSPR